MDMRAVTAMGEWTLAQDEKSYALDKCFHDLPPKQPQISPPLLTLATPSIVCALAEKLS